ncbi:RHS repeat domain-containing protein [Flectobacillus major]|uniref:RHS repeat domain-containing protein n=1 Tax=Flectobacillus major TaxID=103 RepID=UPI0004273B13|nr:RHS repeat-associated core domain-containing protein [Flectobacillus major]
MAGLWDANNDLTNSLFSYKLTYEEDGTYYDGNIRNQYWKSNIDGIQRAYQYNYDGTSRITAAAYGSTKAGENYALNDVTYDANGNITNLSRNGWKANNTFGLIDNLNYTYNTNSNKILKVDDVSGEESSFKDVSGNDYTYWQDGSLKSDANKGITLIEYNYLKLPKKIVKGSTTILYQYDATGRKLKETIGSDITDYSANKIYKNNILYQISHDEGRIVNGEYEYNIKDHLGNLRVAFKDSLGIAKITQANAYGVWGEDLPTLKYLNTPNLNNFTYQGKELISQTGQYDFGARMYDPIIGRWGIIDPKCELMRRWSPFCAFYNNPLRFIDPDGMMPDDYFNKKGEYLGTDNASTDNVRIIDQQVWNEKKSSDEKGNDIIEHKVGEENSQKFSEANLDSKSTLSVYQHYNPTDLKLEISEQKFPNGKSAAGAALSITSVGEKVTDKHIDVFVKGNNEQGIADHANEIKNVFVHEKQHYNDFKTLGIKKYNNMATQTLEQRAVFTQINDPTFLNTRNGFQRSAKAYGSQYKLNFSITTIPPLK